MTKRYFVKVIDSQKDRLARTARHLFNNTVILTILILPVIHVCVSELVTSLIALSNGVAPVWPSIGIYLAGIFLFGKRLFPAILVSELIFNFLLFKHPIAVIGTSFASLIEQIINNFYIHRFLKHQNPFTKSQHLFKFLATILISPILASIVGARLFLHKDQQ